MWTDDPTALAGSAPKSFRMLDMRAGASDVAANFGRRAQAARNVHPCRFFYRVGYVASIAEQEPVFIQIRSFHAQKGVSHLRRGVAPSHVGAKQAQGEKRGIANQKMRLNMLVVRHGLGRGREIRFEHLKRLGQTPDFAVTMEEDGLRLLRLARDKVEVAV